MEEDPSRPNSPSSSPPPSPQNYPPLTSPPSPQNPPPTSPPSFQNSPPPPALTSPPPSQNSPPTTPPPFQNSPPPSQNSPPPPAPTSPPPSQNSPPTSPPPFQNCPPPSQNSPPSPTPTSPTPPQNSPPTSAPSQNSLPSPAPTSPPPHQNSPPTSQPSQNSPPPTEPPSSHTSPLTSPPCDQSPQINPEVKTDPSPSASMAGTRSQLGASVQDITLLETQKVGEMWESFIQKGIEHDFTQDLARFSVPYSQIFDANSRRFYERCVELLENMSLPPTPIPPSVMQEIKNLPKFLKNTREQRLLIMENVRRSLPRDTAHSQVSATSSQMSTASAYSASEEVNSYSYENETLVNLLNPNNLNLFCEMVAKFSEYLAKNKSDSATSSSSPPN